MEFRGLRRCSRLTTDDAGFLLPHYSAGDNVHGNAAYGAILLRRVVDCLPPPERDAIVQAMAAAPVAA